MRRLSKAAVALVLLAPGCLDESAAASEPYQWVDRYLLADQVPGMLIEVYAHDGWEPTQSTLDAIQQQISNATGRSSITLRIRGTPQATAGSDNTWDQNEVRGLVDELLPAQVPGSGVAAIAFVAGRTNQGQIDLGGVGGLGGGAVAIVFSEQMSTSAAIHFLDAEVPNPNFEAFERAGAVHELGHVLGLIDREVPRRHGSVSSDGAHSNDPASVMYPVVHSQDPLGIDPNQIPYRFTADDVADIRDYQAGHGFRP